GVGTGGMVTKVEAARIAAAAGVPVVVVLPEVNLGDWETRQPPALLFGEAAGRWHAHLARGLTALVAGRIAAAESAAWAMVELDGGFSTTPFRLLAEAARRDGRAAEARDAAISEIDALHYPLMAFLAAPRAGTAERRLLAAEAERRGWGAVDLRQAFAAATGEVLPGRRLFLDYCHLTREGMKIAMAAVAGEVLRRAGGGAAPETGPEAGPEALRRRLAALPEPEVPPQAEAVAFLGAAVHTAHRHLPVTDRRDLLVHWCRRALATSAGVAAALLDLADARTAPLPEALTAAQQRNLRSAYPLTLQHGWRWDGADADLLAAMRATLAEAGRPEAAEMERLLAHRRPPRLDADLLPTHLAEPLARPFPEAMAPAGLAPRATLRCLWPTVGIETGTGMRRLEVVARHPEGAGPSAAAEDGTAAVEAAARAPAAGADGDDGAVGGSGLASSGWLRWHLAASGPRLTLGWPLPADGRSGGDRLVGTLDGAIRDLEEGREALLHQSFGELYSIRAVDD
ncbi:MAG TPA: hypothetical protein VHQ65_15170, partial [Thermoanaerobaculia bacterium]|nr:hypothetical protein [Thermoanaerobaculia bacterium]